MPVNVKVDISKAVEGLDDLRRTQLPFAMAKTLTKVAQAGQSAVRESLSGKFTLRNKFTEQGIRIQPADKKLYPIQASVYTRTENDKTGAPDYLGPQERGGEKFPHNGHEHLAVPTKYLRKYAPRAIPDELRPKALLPPDAQEGKVYTGTLSSVHYGQKLRSGKRLIAKVGGYAAFIARAHSGTLCIFVRAAAFQGAGSNRDAEPWYVLIPQATITPRLGMAETVTKAVQQSFDGAWRDVWVDIELRGIRRS